MSEITADSEHVPMGEGSAPEVQEAVLDPAQGSDDPFAYLLDNEPTASESAPQEGVGETQEPSDQRIRDWQSKHDSLASEFDTYKRNAEEANAIWKYVQKDPAVAQRVFSTIEESLSGTGSDQGGVGSATTDAESTPLPQEPTPPDRPADYSEQDAWMEPNSSSFQYRKASERYELDLAKHEVAMTRYELEQQVAPIRSAFEQQQQVFAQQQHMASIANNLMQAGIPEEEAVATVQWANQYEVTVEDLVALRRMKNGGSAPTQAAPQQQQPREQIQARNQRLKYPLPPSTGASQPQQPNKSRGDQMMDRILNYEKAKNPWG